MSLIKNIMLTTSVGVFLSIIGCSDPSTSLGVKQSGDESAAVSTLYPTTKIPIKLNISIAQRSYSNSLKKAAALPASVDLTKLMSVPGDQGLQNSCTAWAVGYALKTSQVYDELGWGVVNKTNHQFSPAFLYNQLNDGKDEGIDAGDALTLMKNNGCSSLSAMPYNSSSFTTQPSTFAKNEAARFKVGDYDYVFTLADLKAKLAERRPVVLAIRCYYDLFSMSSTNKVYDTKSNTADDLQWYRTASGKPAATFQDAGHAILAVGYNSTTKLIKFINSWGKKWCENGYGYIHEDMMTKFGYVWNGAAWETDATAPVALGYVLNVSTVQSKPTPVGNLANLSYGDIITLHTKTCYPIENSPIFYNYIGYSIAVTDGVNTYTPIATASPSSMKNYLFKATISSGFSSIRLDIPSNKTTNYESRSIVRLGWAQGSSNAIISTPVNLYNSGKLDYWSSNGLINQLHISIPNSAGVKLVANVSAGGIWFDGDGVYGSQYFYIEKY